MNQTRTEMLELAFQGQLSPIVRRALSAGLTKGQIAKLVYDGVYRVLDRTQNRMAREKRHQALQKKLNQRENVRW